MQCGSEILQMMLIHISGVMMISSGGKMDSDTEPQGHWGQGDIGCPNTHTSVKSFECFLFFVAHPVACTQSNTH